MLDSDDSLLLQRCGKGAAIVKSSGNTMKVEFYSDSDSFTGRGFNATWRKVSEDVSEIYSPNFPQSYPLNFDGVRSLESSN